ncbi:MAG TPA: hypothetical protein VMW13_09415 [Dehalococcoidales bacterium]|nr:hypothetical protein [Dehalococcoidales bacterium]
MQNESHGINLLNEKQLHAALKAWYVRPGDQVEVAVDSYIIDIMRGDLLIEIQTRSFSALKRKVTELVKQHPVRLAYPIAMEKWIVRMPEKGDRILGRRRSPRRGIPADVFEEMVSFPELISNSNFSIELLLIQEEEVRRQDRRRGWRRKGWTIDERRLLKVLDRLVLETPADVAALIPEDLVTPFTTSDLARAVGRPRRLAQRMAYCLRAMGCITPAGKQGNAILYTRTDAPDTL